MQGRRSTRVLEPGIGSKIDTLTLKLILTPTLIGTASLVGRRWGPAVSGWLVGLPLTSGPVAFFLSLSQGTLFATAVALGTLAGAISQTVFCIAYSRLVRTWPWQWSVLASILVFCLVTAILQYVTISLTIVPLFLALIVVLTLT